MEVYDFRSAYPKEMMGGFHHPSIRRCKLALKFVEDLAEREAMLAAQSAELEALAKRYSR